MNRIHIKILIAIVFVLAAIFTSCDKEEELVIDDFQVEIDSILAPDTINLGDIFEVKFYGFLGVTECYVFQRFAVDMPETNISVTTIGGFIQDKVCDSTDQFMDGVILKIFDLPTGDYVLTVEQPRDDPIKSPLYVKE